MLFSTRTSLRVPLLEQELLTLLFLLVFVLLNLFCAMLTIVCHFILFLLPIILCSWNYTFSSNFSGQFKYNRNEREIWQSGATNCDWQWFFRRFSILYQWIWCHVGHLEWMVKSSDKILEETHSSSIKTEDKDWQNSLEPLTLVSKVKMHNLCCNCSVVKMSSLERKLRIHKFDLNLFNILVKF